MGSGLNKQLMSYERVVSMEDVMLFPLGKPLLTI